LSDEITRNVDASNSSFVIEIEDFTISFTYNQEFGVLYFSDISENIKLTNKYINRRLNFGVFSFR